MSDVTLFAVGCAVTFIFLGGSYVAFLASFAPTTSAEAEKSK